MSVMRPEPSTYEVHHLAHCPQQVRSCFGCMQSLKPGQRIPGPPHDIVIVSYMMREFRGPQGEAMRKPGNVYLHVNINCLMRNQPYFSAMLIQVPPHVRAIFLPVHISLCLETLASLSSFIYFV